MNLPTGRPNEVLPGKNGGSESPEVGQFKFLFALTTDAHVNCQRRKKKKDADTNARQNTVRYFARDPRSERGLQKARAPSATSTPTAASGAPGKADGESAGISEYDSKRPV